MIGLLAGGVALAQIDTTAEPGRPSYDPATAMCMRTDKVNEKTCHRYPDAELWPAACGLAVTQFLSSLDDNGRQGLRAVKYPDIKHLTALWGMSIRNRFGLWRGNAALISSCQAMRPEASSYPEDISLIIIQEAWKQLQ
ncbi:MAG: DUF6794 domain-containing protein [Pseudomonadota bacterium]